VDKKRRGLMRICELRRRRTKQKKRKEKWHANKIHIVYSSPRHFIKAIKLVR
jgi:hypothetical protein